ncbi:CLUMA_CG011367, isoform A [Clunio marinus]|uniref:CLUMA_CG011367, isoform A n=1 Tax=Clunio marinus TaxID=568069 RepID=A0A1J1IG33_9DIPT|nr:CLUMA_CG011367, isoform A [Clunio marinus]
MKKTPIIQLGIRIINKVINAKDNKLSDYDFVLKTVLKFLIENLRHSCNEVDFRVIIRKALSDVL